MTHEEKKNLVDAAIMLREYCKSDDGKCGECPSSRVGRRKMLLWRRR